MKNIVLIGFMGTGKTEIGRLLAQKLALTYIDTDSIIEENEGRSINDIFASSGEESFREMESKVLDSLKDKKNLVISTGGGIVLRPGNVIKMKNLGPLVLLWASPEAIYERIKDAGARPLLNVADQMAKIKVILDFRTPIYKNITDFEVDTTRLSPEVACNKIIKFIGKDK
jgi:shikimate kinase